ncbi:MAG: hypothetical protein ACREKS_08180 [Candidatus Rokuibacteriota bacterium]
MVLAALIGGAVAWIVSLRVARTPRIVKVLNARRLQIWDENGNLKASLFGNSAGNAEFWLGSKTSPATTILSANGLLVGNPNPADDSNESVTRISLGVDDKGTAALEVYDDDPGEGYIPGPRIDIRVTREGAPSVRLHSSGPAVTLDVVPKGDGFTMTFRRIINTPRVEGETIAQAAARGVETISWEWPPRTT